MQISTRFASRPLEFATWRPICKSLPPSNRRTARMKRFRIELVLLFFICSVRASGTSLNLVSNPSFEQGNLSPISWELLKGAEWRSGDARTGERSLAVTLKKSGRAAISDPIPIDSAQSYRVDGYVLCRTGRARVGFDVLDSTGHVIDKAGSAWIRPDREWTFTADES